MSRCYCCNKILTPQESTRRFKESGKYTDTCSSCLKDIDIPTVDSKNFQEKSYEDDDWGDSADEYIDYDDEELDEE